MGQKRTQFYQLGSCVVCGRSFRKARWHAKTCSPACRKKLSRAGQKKSELGYSGVTLQQLEMLV